MTQNIIIGKNSSLTESNSKNIKNCVIFSANQINEKYLFDKINKIKKVNLIFNNFFPSKFLNDLNHLNYKQLTNLSLEKIFFIFEKIPINKINKIIYTSSSAVYRLSESISSEKIDKFNRQLYSSFKLSAERMIMNFANKNDKDYFIMRLFNTYGDKNDQFSFVERIIKSKKNNTKITLINDGISLRDFIHLDDISKIYNLFLQKNFKKGIYDIGTGQGILIRDILELSQIKSENIKRLNKIEELQSSIADNRKLLTQIPNFKFKNLTQYIKHSLKIKGKIKPKLISYAPKKITNTFGVAIYGVGFAGKQIYRELKKNNENILFFIDDDIKLQNTLYDGVPIISYEEILKNKLNLQIKRIYLSIPSINQKLRRKVIHKLKKNFIDVRFLPEKKFLLSDRISLNDLNIEEINTILQRKQIKLKRIRGLYNKTIMVTGAGGTIGSEICRQLIQQKVKKVIALDKSEFAIYNLQKNLFHKKITYKLLDINKIFEVKKIIKKERVNFIFHAAAYKHVNILEKNIFSAVTNNILATYKLCNLCSELLIKMVFISTDKAANPKSVLGYSKRYAEKICEYFNEFRNKDNLINIVRFGNVFGSSGSAINNFLDQINLNKIVNITHKNASRYFMTISEACHLVLQTTEIRSKNKIFVLDMGKPLNILKLAKKLGEIKSKINPSYNFRYKIVGLKPGEKIHETIVDDKEIKTKINNEIFFVKSKVKLNENFIKNLKNLLDTYKEQSEKKLFNKINIIKKF